MQSLRSATESVVRMVPEPEFTKSWHPVSHGKVIDSLELAVKNYGLDIVKRQYSLHNKGMNMFGTWHLSSTFNGGGWMVGLRNSMNKSFAIGICAGTNVFVCSNMMFSGKFIEVRRHTSGVDLEELRRLSFIAIDGIIEELQELETWHTGLRNYPMNEEAFKLTTFDAMKEGAIPPSRFLEFMKCHEEEVKLNDRSLYTFHGGVTRLIRDNSLFSITNYSKKLIGVCDDYIQRAA